MHEIRISISFANRNDIPITTLFWINLCALVVIDFMLNRKSSQKNYQILTHFILLSQLLHQSHNLIMNVACVITCWFLNQACNRMVRDKEERLIAKIALHWWTGKLFYFYQVIFSII